MSISNGLFRRAAARGFLLLLLGAPHPAAAVLAALVAGLPLAAHAQSSSTPTTGALSATNVREGDGKQITRFTATLDGATPFDSDCTVRFSFVAGAISGTRGDIVAAGDGSDYVLDTTTQQVFAGHNFVEAAITGGELSVSRSIAIEPVVDSDSHTESIPFNATATCSGTAISFGSAEILIYDNADAPALAEASPDSGSLALTWSAPANTGDSSLTNYQVRWADKSAAGVFLNTGAAAGLPVPGDASVTTHTITGLTNGITYQAQVAAVNSEGAGIWSKAQEGTPTAPPGAPAALTATPADAALSLAWTTPAEDGGLPITGYRYRWSNDNDAATWENASRSGGTSADGLDISGSGAGTVEYTLASLTNGATYAVQIAAVNANGRGDWSASAMGRPLAAPGAPRQPELDGDKAALFFMWMPPADTGGADAGELVYQLRWRDAAVATFANSDAAATAAGKTSYRITGLTNGATYIAQTRAQSDGGMSAWSAEARGIPVNFHIDFDATSGVGWTEGVAVLRWILGLRGNALTAGLTGLEGAAARINSRLGANRDALDVNGDGEVTAADGILIARFFLGVDSADLLAGQAAADAVLETVKTALEELRP